jgi:hypothetical protein
MFGVRRLTGAVGPVSEMHFCLNLEIPMIAAPSHRAYQTYRRITLWNCRLIRMFWPLQNGSAG